jgi:hypothetical protein
VIYRSKGDSTSKTFKALDWLARLVTHIPNKGEQMISEIRLQSAHNGFAEYFGPHNMLYLQIY